MANCSAALTNTSFTHDGTAYTVTGLYGAAGGSALYFKFNPSSTERSWRRLTLHLDDKSYPAVGNDAAILSSQVIWQEAGITWTDGQKVQVRLTAGDWVQIHALSPPNEVREDTPIGSVPFTVYLPRAVSYPVSVDYATADGVASTQWEPRWQEGGSGA